MRTNRFILESQRLCGIECVFEAILFPLSSYTQSVLCAFLYSAHKIGLSHLNFYCIIMWWQSTIEYSAVQRMEWEKQTHIQYVLFSSFLPCYAFAFYWLIAGTFQYSDKWKWNELWFMNNDISIAPNLSLCDNIQCERMCFHKKKLPATNLLDCLQYI